MTETVCASSPVARPLPTTTGRHWRAWLIAGASLGVHAVIIGLLSFPAPPAPTKPVEIIAARLMIPTPATKVLKPSLPDSQKPPDDLPVVDLPETTTPAPSDNQSTTQRNTDNKPTTIDEVPDAPDNAPDAEVTTSTIPAINPRAALDTFMSTQQQQAIHKDSAAAASEFRRRQYSPDLTDPRKYQTEKEALAGPPPKRINCSSTVNKVIASLSGFAGGSLRCSEMADFEPYLEKRLKAHSDN